jgi:hypothetical protein
MCISYSHGRTKYSFLKNILTNHPLNKMTLGLFETLPALSFIDFFSKPE